jgi:hypothetical protein
MILEFVLNTGFSYLLAKLLDLSGLDLFLVIAGATFIDADHIIHFLLKGVSLNELKSTFKQEFKNHHPNFYIFHTFEFLLLGLFFTWSRDSHWLYLFLGFSVNFTIDIITYLFVYKSTHPWLAYFSAVNQLIFGPKRNV